MMHSRLIKHNCKTCGQTIEGLVFRDDLIKTHYTLHIEPSCECYLTGGDYYSDEQDTMMDEGRADISLTQQTKSFIPRNLIRFDLWWHTEVTMRVRSLRYDLRKWREARAAAKWEKRVDERLATEKRAWEVARKRAHAF